MSEITIGIPEDLISIAIKPKPSHLDGTIPISELYICDVGSSMKGINFILFSSESFLVNWTNFFFSEPDPIIFSEFILSKK